jgi:hypothetical protein
VNLSQTSAEADQFHHFLLFMQPSIKLLRRRLGRVSRDHELPFADARDRTARRPKRLEAEHGTCESFHCPMILFYDVTRILQKLSYQSYFSPTPSLTTVRPLLFSPDLEGGEE